MAVTRYTHVITDDSGLGLDCLNGFPGVYIKCMLEKLKDKGIAELVSCTACQLFHYLRG